MRINFQANLQRAQTFSFMDAFLHWIFASGKYFFFLYFQIFLSLPLFIMIIFFKHIIMMYLFFVREELAKCVWRVSALKSAHDNCTWYSRGGDTCDSWEYTLNCLILRCEAPEKSRFLYRGSRDFY